MRKMVPFLLLVAACAAPSKPPQMEKGLPDTLLDAMRRFASADCPVPPEMPVMDMVHWRVALATVVAADQGMLVMRVENAANWPEDRQHLLLPVVGGVSRNGIKGDAVVVGQCGELLICRFFQSSHHVPEPPAVGDQAVVDHATSREMRAAWRARRT